MWWNVYTHREEPVSNYWKGKDVSEIYCSAKCGLEKQEKDDEKN